MTRHRVAPAVVLPAGPPATSKWCCSLPGHREAGTEGVLEAR